MKQLGTQNLPANAGDPASPANGDIWYNSARGKFRKKERSVITDFGNTDNVNLVGNEYNKSSWANLTDFTTNTMSATVSSSKIQIPDANVSDFTKSLQLSNYTSVNHWKMIVVFKRTANPGGAGTGISIGIQSTNTNALCSNILYFAGAGTMQLFYQSNGSSYTTSGQTSTALTYANNDLVQLSIERDNQTIIMNAQNLTTPSNVQRTLTRYLNLIGDPIPANTGHWTIWAQGGTFEIQSIQCINKEVYNPALLIIGDSKVQGYGNTVGFSGTIGGWISKQCDTVSISSGFGDRTNEVINNLTQLTGMMPQAVLLAIGSNDIRFGSSVATFMTNYATIRNAFIAIGANIIDVSPMYESAIALATQYSTFMSTYSSAVDVYDETRRYGLYSDGIHLSDAASEANARKIIDRNVIYNKASVPVIDRPGIETAFTPTNLTQTGTTAASGTLTATYRLTQVSNVVTIRFFLAWVTQGSAITQVVFDLPPGIPAPEVPSGYSANNAMVAVGSGGMGATLTVDFAASRAAIHNFSTATSGFQISCTAGSTNLKGVELCFQYFTNVGL